MEAAEVKELFSKLSTISKLVKVYYRNQYGDCETKPDYLMNIFDTPLEEIPEQWRDNFC